VTVVAVVPAHNEADVVAATVAAIRSLPQVSRILVVDDASTDTTAAVAEGAGADVLRLPANLGKGAALEAGLQAVQAADVVLLLDADLGDTASAAAALLAPVVSGEADMAVAILPRPAGSGGFGLVKRLAGRGIARLGGGFASAAPLSGQRALGRAAVAAVRPLAFGYGAEVAMTVRALRAGLRVVEVPADMAHRATGRDLPGFAHRGRQYRDVRHALRVLAREKSGQRSFG
jgi:glycosyltransferase involved in cell wall biosynthesis